MNKFTPGPWRVQDDGRQINVRTADGMPICELWLVGNETRANAQLLSASPVLLAALKNLLISHAIPSSICKERIAYEEAQVAIARAEQL